MSNYVTNQSGFLYYNTVSPGLSEPGVKLGNWFLNTSTNVLYLCKDGTVGAQVWDEYPKVPVGVTKGGTGLTSTTQNQILYSSAANTIAGLATANNGTLITSAGGVPSISSTLPSTVQGNITSLGTLTSLSSAPAASQSAGLTLGAAYQNTFGYDVVLVVYLNVTVNAGGNVQCGVGPTNTPTQQTLLTGLAVLGFLPVTIYLPKSYYALLSVTVTASIMGQQAFPV